MGGLVQGSKFTPWRVLILFVCINILNYVDRGIVAGIVPKLEHELHITNAEAGTLAGAFMGGYMVASPIFAVFVIRFRPFVVLAFGLALWLLAAAAAAFSQGFTLLLIARIVSGIGEASFQCLAPPFIDDYAPPERKALWLAAFFMAVPVGTALGYLIGGLTASMWTWRAAFVLEGILMIPLLLTCLFIPHQLKKSSKSQSTTPWNSLVSVSKEPFYVLSVMGQAAYTYVLGGFAFFGPTYLVNALQMDLALADGLFGGVTAVMGVGATLLGGYMFDKLAARRGTANDLQLALEMCFYVGATSFPVFVFAFFTDSQVVFWSCVVVAELIIFMLTPAINAAIMWSVDPDLRPFAMGLSIGVIHLLGDVPSPIITGAFLDWIHDGEKVMTLLTAWSVWMVLHLFVGALYAPRGISRRDSRSEKMFNDDDTALEEPLLSG